MFNEEIAPGIFHLRLMADEEAATAAYPGQFLNVYPEAGRRMVLPRPFGICDADITDKTIDLVYETVGAGTRWMSEKKRRSRLKITNPLGRGFRLDGLKELQKKDPRPAVLLGGGVGCAPMLFLAKTLAEEEIPNIAVLGFREFPFLAEEFRKTGSRTYVTTEKLNEENFLGTVIDCLEANGISAPAYFACGPRGMLAAADRYVSEDCGDEFLQVSLEERMGCGYGVCVGCSIPVREMNEDGSFSEVRRKVCADGPVFRGSEVNWNDEA